MLVNTMWQTILGIIGSLGLAALLGHQLLRARAKRKAEPERIFVAAKELLNSPQIKNGPTVGSYRLEGTYRGHAVQVQTVVDTLATRKLPSLWLMVTIPEPLPVTATFDMMMRPTGPTTFSNFDMLPATLEALPAFPEQAVVRTDDPAHVLPGHVVAPHLAMFFGPRAKELLITPKGVRMVYQMAEADRARYGVFRQAEFADAALNPDLLRDILDVLIALRADIETWRRSLS